MANSTGTLTVVTAADHQFLGPLAVFVHSLVAVEGHVGLRVIVLTDSITPSDRALLSAAAPVEWVEVERTVTEGVNLPPYLSSPSTWRLLIGELLPGEQRLVYLDADVVIRRPIRALTELDLGGCVVAAVRDPAAPFFACPYGPPWRELGVPPGAAYFNSGVLVIDVPAWRDLDVGRQSLALLRTHRLPHGDQCALNTVLHGRWLPLDPEWNTQGTHLSGDSTLGWAVEDPRAMERAIADPAVVHYNHSFLGRPWDEECVHPFAAEWHQHLAATPWPAWRPPGTPLVPPQGLEP